MKHRFLGLMVGVLLAALQGCALVVAIPFVVQNEFDDKREALKRDVEQGRIGPGAALDACTSMLRQVERGHAAPPPFPPEICDFASPAAKRYELTRAIERGVISKEAWVAECRKLDGQQACSFEPLNEIKEAWKRQVKDGLTTREAAEIDCRKLLTQRPAWMALPANVSPESCSL